MKKTRLIVEYDYEFGLLGIISSVKFYKLAWAINNKLNISLVKSSDISLDTKRHKNLSFSLYDYSTEQSNFQVFKNKTEGKENAHLIPEMSHLDYIVKIDENSQSFAIEEVMKALREVKWIEYIAVLDVDNLKSRDNFLN